MNYRTDVFGARLSEHLGKNGCIIGYARVSTIEQNLDRQIAPLKKLGADPIYMDKVSGASRKRPQLDEAIRYARDGDVFIATSMDRLARSLRDLHEIMDTLTDKGVTVHLLQEGYTASKNVESPQDNLLLGVIGAIMEFERSLIRRRQAEGIAEAKKRGTYKGRPRMITEEQIATARDLIAQGIPRTRVAKLLGIGRTTLYEYIPAPPPESEDDANQEPNEAQ